MDDEAATLDDTGFPNTFTSLVDRNAEGASSEMSADPVDENATDKVQFSRKRFTYASGATPLKGYTIKRGIGIGGFGEVYFAVSDAGKEVALKHIQRNLDVELRGVSQCINLKHINLITLWDIQRDDDGEGWVIMEYVPGNSLRDVCVQYSDGMPMDVMEKWFTQACAGVGYLHQHGIVHRDLKPGNIFFDSDQNVVKIGDYGLSKFMSYSRRSGQTESVGTFHYMAPEIGKGMYGKEIDVYALGIILCEMLTGKVPFDGESSQEIIMKHLTADPEIDHIPQPFQKVIRKSLAKDPDRRYSTVEEMLAALPFGDGPKKENLKDTDYQGDAVKQGVAGKVPPIEPVTMNNVEPLYIGDDEKEIVFGEVKQNPNGPNSQAGHSQHGVSVHSPPFPQSGHGHVPPHSGYPEKMPPPSYYPPASEYPAGIDNPNQIPPNAVASHHSQHASHVQQNVATTNPAQLKTNFFVRFWNESVIATGLKIAMVIGLMFLIFKATVWLVPILIITGVIFGLFWLLRFVISERESSVSQTGGVKLTLTEIDKAIEKRMRQALAEKTTGDWVSELVDGWLFAGLLVGALTVFCVAINGWSGDWNFYAWIGGTACVASWTLIAIGKVWERSTGNIFVRRGGIAVIGTVLGIASFCLISFLLANFAGKLESETFVVQPTSGYFSDSLGNPFLISFIGFFLLTFLIINWWRKADPLRRTRLSLISVCFCIAITAIAASIFSFPLVWGVAIATMVSTSTQIASPWMDPEQRDEIRQTLQSDA